MARKPKSAPAATASTPVGTDDQPERDMTSKPVRRGRPPKAAAAAAENAPATKTQVPRRGRKPKQTLAESQQLGASASLDQADQGAPITAPGDATAHGIASSDRAAADLPIAEASSSAPVLERAGPGSTAAAARWDRTTDMASFDWPAIERVAAQDGPNQAMAKLLLAARAEGANARWPL